MQNEAQRFLNFFSILDLTFIGFEQLFLVFIPRDWNAVNLITIWGWAVMNLYSRQQSETIEKKITVCHDDDEDDYSLDLATYHNQKWNLFPQILVDGRRGDVGSITMKLRVFLVQIKSVDPLQQQMRPRWNRYDEKLRRKSAMLAVWNAGLDNSEKHSLSYSSYLNQRNLFWADRFRDKEKYRTKKTGCSKKFYFAIKYRHISEYSAHIKALYG